MSPLRFLPAPWRTALAALAATLLLWGLAPREAQAPPAAPLSFGPAASSATARSS